MPDTVLARDLEKAITAKAMAQKYMDKETAEATQPRHDTSVIEAAASRRVAEA